MWGGGGRAVERIGAKVVNVRMEVERIGAGALGVRRVQWDREVQKMRVGGGTDGRSMSRRKIHKRGQVE